MNSAEIYHLQVGDVVCDCRFRHLEVKGIKELWCTTRSLARLFWWAPDRMWDFLEKIWPQELYNKHLTLEDHNQCSAKDCCDVVPHDWEHPTVLKEKHE